VSEARPRAADLAPLDDPAALFARAARSDLAAAEGAHLREVERAGIPVLYFEARTARATQREDARSPTP
jgi:hypothetical protein